MKDRKEGPDMAEPSFSKQLRITVQSYAGYKGDERPVSFSREGRTFQVVDIVDRWYEPDHHDFKVRADDGRIYLLRHDINADDWELVDHLAMADRR